MNTGAPIKAITAPTGNSIGDATLRDSRSAAISNAAPPSGTIQARSRVR